MSLKHFNVRIDGQWIKLPVCPVSDNLAIVLLDLLGDVPLTNLCADGLYKKLNSTHFDTLVTAEAKSIPLVYELAKRFSRPYVVLRKTRKPYSSSNMSWCINSITSEREGLLYLDVKHEGLIKDKDVLIIDDVISSGSTVDTIIKIVAYMGGNVAGVAAVLTEGARRSDVISLDHIPLFTINEDGTHSIKHKEQK